MKQFNRTLALLMGQELLDLRVAFSIQNEMTSFGSSNSEIRIYNLSKAHLTQIEAASRSLNLTLSVGYAKQNKLIYSGPISYAKTSRAGADLITKCMMLPGVAARTAAYVSASGVSNDYQLFQLVLNALAPFGIVQGHVSQSVVQKMRAVTYARPRSESGLSSRLLDMICQNSGLRSNMANNALNVYSQGEYEDAEIVELSKDSGLIGVPSKLQYTYSIKALLNADLRPGKRIRVVSEEFPINGDLKVIRAKYEGDSYEGDWFAELECQEIDTAPGFVLEQ